MALGRGYVVPVPLLLTPDQIDARRAVAAGPLAPLAQGLADELAPLLQQAREGTLYVPREKALLSREGGRCAADGAQLEFDPWLPHTHCCPTCDRLYTGTAHDRYWIYWYQLWLAERAVHSALLYALRGDPRHRELAARILDAYVERYLAYPNRDNVLGPTRALFSTYLESIWLLHLCVALDLLEHAARPGVDGDETHALGERVRDRVIAPSAEIIAVYDEAMSNRQVWNNAALIAAANLLDRPQDAERVILGQRSGVVAHL
jgi:hypothetical protein